MAARDSSRAAAHLGGMTRIRGTRRAAAEMDRWQGPEEKQKLAPISSEGLGERYGERLPKFPYSPDFSCFLHCRLGVWAGIGFPLLDGIFASFVTKSRADRR